jgi:hypothetical protein
MPIVMRQMTLILKFGDVPKETFKKIDKYYVRTVFVAFDVIRL